MKREEMIAVIDTEADIARSLVVGDPVRAFEYQWAEQEALAFKNAGYPVDAVPSSVQAWATAKGWTPQQSADDILAAAQGFRTAMSYLRQARLIGKEGVRNAATDELAEQKMQTALAQIKLMRQQFGG
jgi:hypothetical protein